MFYEVATVLNSGAIATILVAGGWVKVREYFKARAARKLDALKAEADKVEAAIQARINSALAEAKSAPQE